MINLLLFGFLFLNFGILFNFSAFLFTVLERKSKLIDILYIFIPFLLFIIVLEPIFGKY